MRLLALVALLAVSFSAQAEDWLYLTYPGDTLIRIGQEYLKNPNDWPKIQQLNGVPHPRVLPVNTRLRIPVGLLKQTPAPAVISHVDGNVRVKAADGPYRPLAVGDRISGGETVLTGPRSFASFKLADGSGVSQQPSSKLVFGRLAAYGKTGMVSTELNLQGGRIEAGASKQVAPAGGFRVVTPVAVAGLRGTAFRLNLDEEGKTLRSEVLEGAVGVGAQNREVEVGASQGTVTEAGKPPQDPRPLLPAPAAEGLATKVLDLPLRFSWPGSADARAWRAQVAADAEFRRILLESLSEKPEAEWETALPDGHYVLRLRGVDAAGLEGLNLDHPFELDARPLPPVPVSPAVGERSYQESVTFTWAAPEEAHGYLLQIAPDADFTAERTIERRLDAVTQHHENLAAGDYHWRLASLDAQGTAHGWGKSSAFRVQPLPAVPKGEAASADGQASFTWLPVAGAARYEFQLAAAEDFAAPRVRQETEATAVTQALKPGAYFWRVRSLEADGQGGAWSGVARLVMPPEPPVLVKADYGMGRLALRWRGEAAIYRLEVATDPGFQNLVARAQTSETEFSLPLREGQYWLRLSGIDAEGKAGSPGPAEALDLEDYAPRVWWWPHRLD